MKRVFFYLPVCLLLLHSCKKNELFKDAVAAWSFTDLNDGTGLNSKLTEKGTIQLTNNGDDKTGNGKAVYLDGSSWLNAGQGAEDELKIAGKEITLFVRMKPDSLKEYNPLLTKAGDDQNLAYSIALRRNEDGMYIEAMLGSDDIGGSHLLKYKMGQDSLQWHDIVFRFNGKMSELYIDGILRDNEVTRGEIRDWNTRPVLIGAEYQQPYITGDSTANSIAATFKGWIANVAIWEKYITDETVAALSGKPAINKDGLPQYYSEKYRPQFHFTAKKNWLNDPNGLVYYNGVYHMFFQYMPPHRHGAYKDWGHATSKDLVHWQQVAQHITPHKVWGGCWSGSAVVDVNNVSGFQSGKEKPIIAFITNGGSPDDGFGPKCTQCIAYSNDGGNTFAYYDQNPVIKNINGSNRDPKVVWDEDSKKWIMSLYLDKDYDFGLFSSSNLRDWEQLSTVSLDHIAECPGFQPFFVDGDKRNKKWVFSGANGNYVIGTFNGKTFLPERGTIVGDYGNNFYAPQIWSDAPGGRQIQVAWMPTNRYPGMPFEQQMNFPTELTLKTTPQGLRLCRMPVPGIKDLYQSTEQWQKEVGPQGENALKEMKGELYDMDFDIDLQKSASVEIGIRGTIIRYDAIQKMLSCGGAPMQNGFPPDNWKAYLKKNTNALNNMGEAKLPAINGKIKLRILVDRTTVEVYANDGQVVISSCFMPDESKGYTLTSEKAIKVNAAVHALKSIWGAGK